MYFNAEKTLDVLEKVFKLPTGSEERREAAKEMKCCILAARRDVSDALYKAAYWKQRCKEEEEKTNRILTEFAEAVEIEFYKEYEELIPSVMRDKIKALIKEKVSEEGR